MGRVAKCDLSSSEANKLIATFRLAGSKALLTDVPLHLDFKTKLQANIKSKNYFKELCTNASFTISYH
jgi:hypothetical protein